MAKYIFFTPKPTDELLRLNELGKKVGVANDVVSAWARKGRRGGIKLRVCRASFGLASTMEQYWDWIRRLQDDPEPESSVPKKRGRPPAARKNAEASAPPKRHGSYTPPST